ncbi:DUF4358 domain-containing protein [Sporosalibacterium faouarense]|uniref:DUF4358 domain-containing protein n=1 Tax=Sporosalibacterium faouarense TaxID=516123 RepID=UPI00141D6FFA|nr:DUF4358 domain-containing protein [Sporosalibacterium faouarense]MTI47741.1 DUF4358 domain-containing protein [Bacillota bacterium]
MKKVIYLGMIALILVSFIGCSDGTKEDIVDISINEIISKVESNTEDIKNLSNKNLIEQQELAEKIGLDLEAVEAGVIKKPDMGVSPMEIIIIKAKDKSKVEEIKASLEKHTEDLMTSYEGYGAAAVELIENRVLITNDRYILLAVHLEGDQISESFNSLFQ